MPRAAGTVGAEVLEPPGGPGAPSRSRPAAHRSWGGGEQGRWAGRAGRLSDWACQRHEGSQEPGWQRKMTVAFSQGWGCAPEEEGAGVMGSGDSSCEFTRTAAQASCCRDLCGTPVPSGAEPVKGGILP